MQVRQKSLKLNFIFNAIRLAAGFIFPMITFPYTSRILLPEGTGKVAFASSVVAYFIMLSSLGIPLYGIRECARVRDDKEKLTRVTQELIIINLIMTVVSYALLFFAIALVPRFSLQKELLLLISVSILFNTLGMDWFYQALEEYVYITVRGIIFKILSVIFLFTLVHTKEDYMIYAALSVFSSVGSNLLNIINARKYINFKPAWNYHLKKHIRPIVTLSLMFLAVSIYSNLDMTILGFISGEQAVGLYSASVSLIRMILAVATSLGSVLLPRISYYIEQGRNKESFELISKSVDFTLFISLPLIIFLAVFAKETILIFSGGAFLDASLTMRILLPSILLIGLSNLIGVQVLIPMGKDHLTLYSVIIGAAVNFILNMLLAPRYAQNGSAVATLVAETIITLVQLCFAWDILGSILVNRRYIKYFTAAVFLGAVLVVMNLLFRWNSFLLLLVSGIISCVVYFSALFFMKDGIVYNLSGKFREKFNQVIKGIA